MAIQTRPETYTDGIEQHGVSTWVSFHARIKFDDGREEWHYWGEEAPQGAILHEPVHLPADLLAMVNSDEELYRLAFKLGPQRDGVD